MDDSAKATPFSLGVEEEFAIVDGRTGALVSAYEQLMQRAPEAARHHLKPEFLRCVVECITDVCPDVAAVERETRQWRATASALARAAGLAIVASGTHPSGRWWDQVRTSETRYQALEAELRDVARSILIYGLHVHVNIDDIDLRIAVMNQARTFLPQILALSANSPFWLGRNTGFQAFRVSVWAPFPMSGIPPIFKDGAAYTDYIAMMVDVGALDDVRRVWWDLRSHERFPTLEYRIADLPMRHADTMAIVAFIQALTKTLADRTLAGHPLPLQASDIISENRFRAARDGLHGTQMDPDQRRSIPTREVVAATLDLIAPAAADLGLMPYMAHLRQMLTTGYLSGADRQIAADRKGKAGDTTRQAVVEFLMQETMAGIDPRAALPLLDLPPADKR